MKMRPSGFSLAEVTLALGLCSVSLLTIVGLLTVSMKTSVDAGNDTALGAMTAQVLAELSSVPFDTLGKAQPGQIASGSAPLLSADTEDTFFYFTGQGEMVPSSHLEGVYECRVRKKPDAETRSVNGSFNLVKLELLFTWPVGAAQRPGKKHCYASLARQ